MIFAIMKRNAQRKGVAARRHIFAKSSEAGRKYRVNLDETVNQADEKRNRQH
jgi:hypothetical protein